MIHRSAVEQQAAVRIPDLVPAILSTRQDGVVHEGPIQLQYNAFMCLPLHLLLARLDRLQVDLPVACEEKILAIRGPNYGVDCMGHLRQRRAEHPTSGPHLHSAVLSRRCYGASVPAPFDMDDSPLMRFDLLLLAASLRHEPEGAVGTAQAEEVVIALMIGHSSHSGAECIQVAYLPDGCTLCVPSPDGFVITAGNQLVLFVLLGPAYRSNNRSVLRHLIL
mmetsp:Transcript_38128/g.89372  ORF Transcript_38128/g.89372 Transcript_38128/m.89372 type:complete len:221 (-) Transcript_38128:88-750(-)